ncbi:hypothetical protein DT019_15395 [Streptomyces sp. SDr-06]|nr:hypothetical protein DT019_15395 [Streptomyces sp. SDr-06]
MGHTRIGQQVPPRLLTHNAHAYGAAYQQAFADLAAAHRGEPLSRIVPLLRRAADQALLGFTAADLREQAEAISTGQLYELRITLRG